MQINVEIPDQLFIGDSVTINCQVDNDNDSAQDLTGYKIRCSLHNRFANEVRKATANSGGADTEIEITNDSAGEFSIFVDKDETDNFDNEIYIEIELEDSTGKVTTLYSEKHYFEDDGLSWTSSS